MKYPILLFVLFIMACGDGANRDEPTLRDPAEVHSPEEAIPDTMQIKGDSVIMPDTSR